MPKIPPKAEPLTPFWATADQETVKLYRGNVTDVLARLPEKSVHTAVTSPPYFSLRDYGTGTWEGGDPECKHEGSRLDSRRKPTAANVGTDGNFARLLARAAGDNSVHGRTCTKCGAVRRDDQLGSEAVADCKQLIEVEPGLYRKGNCAERDWATGCHVCRMVLVFRGVRRVLRDEGTLWLNYGDSYGAGGQLQGVPWKVALALQADGWVLRQDIVWHKPSPMPESVRNRCTKAHEYVFLLAKGPRYFCDMEAIKTKAKEEHLSRYNSDFGTGAKGAEQRMISGTAVGPREAYTLSNRRSVWSISSAGYPGAHFATFPEELPEICILAGTSAHGCCADCGAPWRRVTAETKLRRERPNEFVKRVPESWKGKTGGGRVDGSTATPDKPQGAERGSVNTCSNSVAGVAVETVGWEPTCACHGRFVKRRDSVGRADAISAPGWAGSSKVAPLASAGELSEEVGRTVEEYVSDLPLEDHPVVPCTVCDIFVGSGTTCAVSLEHGRRSVGIDLSENYLRDNAIPRIEGVLLSKPETAWLAGRKAKKVTVGRPATRK